MPFYRVYVEKKPNFNTEAKILKRELISSLELSDLSDLRIIHRYDAANIDLIDFYNATSCVFSNGQTDVVYSKEPDFAPNERVFAVEVQPDKSDCRAKMCAQEIAMLTKGPLPIVKYATVYVLKGVFSNEEFEKVKNYLINPLLSREAVLELIDNEIENFFPLQNNISPDTELKGFISTAESNLTNFLAESGVNISENDAIQVQNYFKNENRDPTLSEMRFIEFLLNSNPFSVANTKLREITIASSYINKTYRKYTAKRKEVHSVGNINISLSDIAELTQNKSNSEYTQNICMHDELSDINSFSSAKGSVKRAVNRAIANKSIPLSAARTGGMPNPLVEAKISGLFGEKICIESVKGASQYANILGIPTSSICEKYNDCFAAKPLNIFSVIGKRNVLDAPVFPGDVILFAEYNGEDFEKQKKFINLLKNENAANLIKKCICGNLASELFKLELGVKIDFDKTNRNENLTRFNFSKTAFVTSKENASYLKDIATKLSVEISEAGFLADDNTITFSLGKKIILSLKKDLLNVLGNSSAYISLGNSPVYESSDFPNTKENWAKTIASVNTCSQRGIIELFDSTVTGKTVLGPLCGTAMLTPSQGSKVYVSDDESIIYSSAYFPDSAVASPYHCSIYSVISALAKNIASGGSYNDAEISFKFPLYRTLRDMPRSSDWKNIFSAMMGLFEASTELNAKFIKDKYAFEQTSNLNLPAAPFVSVVSKATNKINITPDFKEKGSKVILILPRFDANNLPNFESIKDCFVKTESLIKNGIAKSVYAITKGGVCEAISKMCFGSRLGFAFSTEINRKQLFGAAYGGFLIEVPDNFKTDERVIGKVTDNYKIVCSTFTIEADELQAIWEARLETIYPCRSKPSSAILDKISYVNQEKNFAVIKTAVPKVIIPVFCGTTGETELAKAFDYFGGNAEFCEISSQNQFSIQTSVNNFVSKLKGAQILALPGGFAGIDEPDGAGKYANSFFKNSTVTQAINQLIAQRDGLIIGIGSGFQTLLKSGLITNGKISPLASNSPTLSGNFIGRHQSKIIKTRISSTKSPWTYGFSIDDIHTIPVSHTYGRFIASSEVLHNLIDNGQIIAQYSDQSGHPSMDIRFNPNRSVYAVESVCSPDGRVLGKMAHNERCKNDSYEYKIFENGIKYFK